MEYSICECSTCLDIKTNAESFMEYGSGDENESLMNISILSEKRKERRKQRVGFKFTKDTAISKIPNETLVDIMQFLDRDSLETLQLTSAKFDTLVTYHFHVYPLRRIESCTAKTTKNNKNKIKIVTSDYNNGKRKIIETDSDLHLWLRNCFIEKKLEFKDYDFNDKQVEELLFMEPESLVLNYVFFNYTHKPKDDSATRINFKKLVQLYGARPFSSSNGVGFKFCELTSDYRPSIGLLLTLPVNNLIIDLEMYFIHAEEIVFIDKWLNHYEIRWKGDTPPKNILALEDFAKLLEVLPERSIPGNVRRNLSLQGVEFRDEFDQFATRLQTKFMDDTQPYSYTLDTKYYSDDNYHINLINRVTKEKLKIESDTFQPVHIERY